MTLKSVYSDESTTVVLYWRLLYLADMPLYCLR